ncbi:MAG: hypothetical protein L3J88_06750 [Gammaproteobacteria bacterium]|nr:hypothetical protein [Gammaproteobacteria bacterium]
MRKSKLIFVILFLSSFAAHAVNDGLNVKPAPMVSPLGITYFTIKPDFRKCVAPICGGWFVKAVNRDVSQCPDGSVKEECYVGAERINIVGLSDIQITEIRQAMRESRILIQGRLAGIVDYGLLIIDNAWLSASDQPPSGIFVNVSDNGIHCIIDPCPSYDGEILNKYVVKSLADYDLSEVETDDEQLTLAREAANSGDGLMMAGRFIEVTGPGGSAQGITASQFYLKVESTKQKMCFPTGCSGQICADTDVTTTCEWRPEYACYHSASCSTQRNGDCGWVMDDELRRCLASHVIGGFLQPNVAR